MTRNVVSALAIVVLALIWGYNWVVVKLATENVAPFVLMGLRSALGTVVLLAMVALARRPLRPPPLVPTIVLGIFQTTLFLLCQTLAVVSGGAGKSAVLAYTMPFWTVILAAFTLGERVTVLRAIALALAAAGLGFVLAPFDFNHGIVSKLFALGAAVTWAVSAILFKQLRARYDVDVLTLTAWSTAYGAVPLVAVAVVAPGGFIRVGAATWLELAYIVIAATAIGFWLWNFILSRLSAGAAGIASLLTPVVSVAAAWLQLGERPSALELTGMALIVAALVANSAPQPAARPDARPPAKRGRSGA
jgi:drug/metabolite transporter (DMT)-like permease